MIAGLLMLFLGAGASPEGGPAALWIEGETWFTQAGSHGPDRPPFACAASVWAVAGGQAAATRSCTASSWTGSGRQRRSQLRYARRDPGPARLDLMLDGKAIGGSLQLASTGGWGHLADKEWRYAAVPLGRLSPGWHLLRFVSAADKNNVNLDGFFLAAGPFQPPDGRQRIEAYPGPRIVRGPDAPGPDCMAPEISLEQFSGRLDDWYYPAEEPAERARLTMPARSKSARVRPRWPTAKARGGVWPSASRWAIGG